MKRLAIPLLLGLIQLLAGCLGSDDYRSKPPAPVEKPAQPGAAEVAPYRPPATPETVRPEPNRAVQVLLRRAGDQQAAGDLTAAVVSLERALRIEPHNALLWSRLAHVREQQSQYGLAEDLAQKSNSMAAYDAALKQDNWSLIARVRRAVGDVAGARAAESQAERVRW